MERKTILVVEDELALLDIIRERLDREGFDVLTARSADQAMDTLEHAPRVDFAWLDHYLLGDKNGFDVLKAMKQDGRYRHIPVFLVSNTASDEKVNSYIELGTDRYFVKIDYRLDEIIEEVKRAMKAQK